jgi:hypothetical protein
MALLYLLAGAHETGRPHDAHSGEAIR